MINIEKILLIFLRVIYIEKDSRIYIERDLRINFCVEIIVSPVEYIRIEDIV